MASPDSPSPLHLGGVFTSWQLRPGVLLAALVLLVAYLLVVRRLTDHPDGWPLSRTASYVAGVAVGVVALSSFLGVYEARLFWVLAVQISLLLTVVPGLLAGGRPLDLIARAGGTRGVDRLRRHRIWRLLTSVLVAPLVIPVVLAVVVFTGILPTALAHPPLMNLLQLALVAIGLLMALPLLGDAGQDTALGLGIGVLVGLAELIIDAIPGLVLRLKTDMVAASWWVPNHRGWGPTALADQQHAGAVLWFVAEAVDLPFLGLLFVRWIRADAAEAARVDAELDAAGDGTELTTPWWLQGGPRRT